MSITDNLNELKPLKQWVNYIRIWNPTKHSGAGGYDKPPINPYTLRDGKTTDAATWATYTEAAANIGKTARHRDTKHKDERGNAPIVSAAVEGTGLVLAGGYCGVDLDGVMDENGNLAPFAARIIEVLDTYTEISPSGRGLHCLLYCEDLLQAGRNFGKQFLLDTAGRITNEAGKRYELEVYFYTNGGRYFTVTGKVYRDRPIARDKSKYLLRLYDFYTDKAKQYRATITPPRPVGTHSEPSRPVNGDGNRTMIESALQAIDPAELDFGEWAAIGSGLKQNGYSCDVWENWSDNGGRNSKHVTNYTYTRWENLKDIDEPTRAILGIARRFGWSAADAFTDEQRTKYGQSLYTDEQRAEYGRSLYTEEQRREYGRSLYTEEQRREYGRKMNQLTPEEERRYEEIAKALRERAKRKTQTPTAKGWN